MQAMMVLIHEVHAAPGYRSYTSAWKLHFQKCVQIASRTCEIYLNRKGLLTNFTDIELDKN